MLIFNTVSGATYNCKIMCLGWDMFIQFIKTLYVLMMYIS